VFATRIVSFSLHGAIAECNNKRIVTLGRYCVTAKQKPIPIFVRLPRQVKTWIAREAKRNGASQNSEIIRCIRARMDANEQKAGNS
jgi:hypothetical protein